MAVRITTDDIRVTRPGIDPATAGEKDLLISKHARTGQIVQSGHITLTGSEVAGYSGTGVIGPYSRAPEVIGYARNVGGYTHHPPCTVSDLMASAGGPAQLAETFICSSMEISESTISVSGSHRGIPGTPAPNGFAYVIYRKPNRG